MNPHKLFLLYMFLKEEIVDTRGKIEHLQQSIKAKDVFDEESDWGTLEVSMPKSKAINTMPLFLRFLENFFERYLNAFPILRQLLGL